MKKILLSIVVLSTSYAFTQNVAFTDPDLKQKIVLHGRNVVGGVTGTNISIIDTDLNGEISISEAQAYTGRLYLNQNGSNFYTDLTGVEEFINITELFCQNNQMTTLDVSANTSLTLLDCEYNQITSLNLTNNVALTTLNYSYNDLPSVNLSTLVNLTQLTCDHSNITNIDLSANVNLVRIDCFDNNITTLDLSNNTELTDVSAYNNQLTSINLLGSPDLDDLYLGNNLLTAINLVNNINLRYFGISDNSLTELDLSTNTSLRELYANNNEITTLDLSSNINLGELYAANNLISNLILSNGTDGIYIQGNLLTSLDLSGNVDFWGLNCSNNSLTSLNVANTGNTNVYELIATGNPDLPCIQVDDVAYSTTNWTSIDAQTSFSTDCPTLVNSITVEGENSISEITMDGGTLQMLATILPADATDGTYTWSVTNGTGAGTIDNSGLLTATNNGTVTVNATANDASGTSNTAVINISNQTTLSINNNSDDLTISVYPNPSNGELNIKTNSKVDSLVIMNLSGQKVFESSTSKNDISELKSGLYLVKITTSKTSKVIQLIIE